MYFLFIRLQRITMSMRVIVMKEADGFSPTAKLSK